MSESKISVLVMGATGRSGLACATQLAASQRSVEIHGFCRTPSKLNEDQTKLYTSIIVGNAREEKDVEKALQESKAKFVIVAIGDVNALGPTDTRTVSAQVLTKVLQNNPEYQDVLCAVISSLGSGKSDVKIGMGMGMMLKYILRNVLIDHTEQEKIFMDGMADRTLVVRPTGLRDSDKPTSDKTVVEFGDGDLAPSSQIDRKEVADWICREMVFAEKPEGNRIVNITSIKK